MMNNDNAISQIKDLLSRQTKAVREKNITGAAANYAPDAVVFDVVGPLGHPKGNESVKDRLRQWFSTFKDEGAIEFELVNVAITAEDNLAFSHSFNHVKAELKAGGALDMYWRETLNWRKRDGEWKIVHSHSSVPFDASNGQALTGLKP